MDIHQELKALQEIPFFSGIDDPKMKLIAFASQRLHFQPGEAVFEEGDPTDSIYIILSGKVDVIINVPDGKLKVSSMGKNTIFGEIGVLCNVPRTASIVASTELETLKIEKSLFIQLVRDFPDIALSILDVLGQYLVRYNKFIGQISKEQAESIMREIGEA